MRRLRTLLAAFLLVGAFVPPGGAAAACSDHLLEGREPVLSNAKLRPKTRQICYEEFALLHSGLTRTPLWVAEYINRRQARAAARVNRAGSFHADPNIPEDER